MSQLNLLNEFPLKVPHFLRNSKWTVGSVTTIKAMYHHGDMYREYMNLRIKQQELEEVDKKFCDCEMSARSSPSQRSNNNRSSKSFFELLGSRTWPQQKIMVPESSWKISTTSSMSLTYCIACAEDRNSVLSPLEYSSCENSMCEKNKHVHHVHLLVTFLIEEDVVYEGRLDRNTPLIDIGLAVLMNIDIIGDEDDIARMQTALIVTLTTAFHNTTSTRSYLRRLFSSLRRKNSKGESLSHFMDQTRFLLRMEAGETELLCCEGSEMKVTVHRNHQLVRFL
jgi:hypothetical protein